MKQKWIAGLLAVMLLLPVFSVASAEAENGAVPAGEEPLLTSPLTGVLAGEEAALESQQPDGSSTGMDSAGEVTGLNGSGNSAYKQYGDVKLQPYNGGYFSLKIPEGWILEVGGEYTSFCFKIYDPQDPSTQVFFYGNLLPFHKSELTKSYWAARDTIAGLGPVLTSHDIIGVLNAWSYTIAFENALDFEPAFPALNNMFLLGGSYYKSTFYSGLADSESVCVITCDTAWDTGCKLTIAGTLVDYDKIGEYGGNMFYNLLNLYGIMAPADRYDQVFDSLQECVKSLIFTNAYLQAAREKLDFMADTSDRTAYLKYLAGIMKLCYESYGR